VFKRRNVYTEGDIGMMFASVKQPYQYQIDEVELSRAGSRYTAQRSRDACTELESRVDGGKLRPCLIMGQVGHGNKPSPVSLLATFGKEDISKFPRGVRHHLIPIHTSNSKSLLGQREHLHTTPDWDGRSPQYIIAFEYLPREHRVIEHFRSSKTDRMPNGTNYTVDAQALADFRILCAERTFAWQSLPQAIKKQDAKVLLVH